MPESEAGDLACFEAFRWPVPRAFAGAVAASRFEAGDVLYRDARAYDALAGDALEGLSAIQVVHPPRSARTAPLEGEGDRRLLAWRSEVRVVLVELAGAGSEPRTLSQGKLLMALWSGDESWLEPDREEPELPLGVRDLHARLADARPVFVARAKRRRTRAGSRFLMAVDLAQDAHRAKAADVERQLRSAGRVDVVDLAPAEAGIEQGDRFHPTLVVRGFTIRERDPDSLEPLLRACLYQGGGATDESGDEAADRFSVSRHGLLEAV